jgi:hypothetical protein
MSSIDSYKNQLQEKTNNIFNHHFYCMIHDDGFIIQTFNDKTPNKFPDHCCTNYHNCDVLYHGLKPKSESYYERCCGGWEVEYFQYNIYHYNEDGSIGRKEE